MNQNNGYPVIRQWYHCHSSRAKTVLISDLPKISETVQYQQAIRLPSHIGAGRLSFRQRDFLQALENRLLAGNSRNETHLHPFDAALLDWARDVNTDTTEPCLLPVSWDGIEIPLLALVRKNAYVAYCAECNQTFHAGDLSPCDFFSEGNTTFEGIFCPRNHRLFVTEICQATT